MTPEQKAAWLASRAGKLTASKMADAMDFLKNGQPSKKRTDLIRNVLAERLTGDSVRNFVNDAMVWGQDNEPGCKTAYETHTGQLIVDCGLYDHPEIDCFAATPDGLLGADGLIECKCPTSPTYTDWLIAGVVPEQHKPQMAAQLLCTGRKWVEFVAFDPRVKDPALRLFIRRFEPDAEYLAKVESAAIDFLAEVDAAWEQLTTKVA